MKFAGSRASTNLLFFSHRFPGISQDIPGYPRISQDIPEYPGISRDIPGYPGISQDIPGYPGVSLDIPGYHALEQCENDRTLRVPWTLTPTGHDA